MCLSNIKISDDAIFVADSHYNSNRQELTQLLLDIQSNKIKTSQLFLMGDIFDFLAYQISYFKNKNKNIINLINNISSQIEIIYIEGNHDYNLQKLFPSTQVIPREKQPLVCTYKDKKIAISHGDIFTPFGYDIYTKIIRNSLVLNILNFIDINNWLTTKIDNWLLEKDIYNECTNSLSFTNSRIDLYTKYDIDLIIEGHFHYGINNKNYINIPSLACNKKYYSIKENNFICLS